jgi:putative inorganic carbon (HCO3(-)) transporter
VIHLGISGIGGYLVYFGAILVFFLSALWRPEFGIFFLAPLLPLQNTRYRLHALPYGEKLIDFVLVGVVIGLLVRRGKIFESTPITKFIVIFAVYSFASLCQGSLFLGIDLPFSIQDTRFSDWKNYIEMFVLYLLVVNAIRTTQQIKILVALMCISFLLVNRVYYNTVGSRDFTHFSYELRDVGPLGYAGENGFAAFETEFSIFLLGLFMLQKGLRRRLPLLLLIATGVYCLLFSFSRGGYLAFMIGLAFLGLFKNRKLLVVLTIFLASWSALVPGAVKERITMTYDGGSLDHSAEARVHIWDDAVNVISQSPLIGTGFYTYRSMGRTEYTDTHNYYLKVFVEMGLVGLVVYLWLLTKLFRMGFGLYQTSPGGFLGSIGLGYAALIVSAAVLNLFGDRWDYLQVNGFLWILLGCVTRAQELVTGEQEHPNEFVKPECVSVNSIEVVNVAV